MTPDRQGLWVSVSRHYSSSVSVVPQPAATHCTTCGVELTDETANRRLRTGSFRSPCKACAVTYRRAWAARARPPHHFPASTAVCSVCGSSDVLTPKGRVRLDATDRDPATGKELGLLCPGCRKALEAVGRDPERLRQAAVYLESQPRAAGTTDL